jgi:hypothetical protein
MQCSFLEYKGEKIIYRRYASLFFILGVDDDENEIGILEFIHCLVETMDRFVYPSEKQPCSFLFLIPFNPGTLKTYANWTS